MTLSGTLTGSAINAEFTAATTTTSLGQQGPYGAGKKFAIPIEVLGLASTTPQSQRIVEFTAQDDYYVAGIYLRHTDVGASKTIRLTISAQNPLDGSATGFEDYDNALTAGYQPIFAGTTRYQLALTSIIGTTEARIINVMPVTDYIPVLVKGIGYRIELLNTGVAATFTAGQVILRQKRRLNR